MATREIKEEQGQSPEEREAFLLQKCRDLENENEQCRRMMIEIQSKMEEDKRKACEEASNHENVVKRAVLTICENVHDFMANVQDFQINLGTSCKLKYFTDGQYTPNLETLSSCVEEITTLNQSAKASLIQVTKDWEDAHSRSELMIERATQSIMYKIIGKEDAKEPKAIDWRI